MRKESRAWKVEIVIALLVNTLKFLTLSFEFRPSYRPSDTELRVEVQPTVTSDTARILCNITPFIVAQYVSVLPSCAGRCDPVTLHN